jgi:hypothetical protein
MTPVLGSGFRDIAREPRSKTGLGEASWLAGPQRPVGSSRLTAARLLLSRASA